MVTELMRAHICSWQTASVPCFSILFFYIKKRHKALKAIKNEIRMFFISRDTEYRSCSNNLSIHVTTTQTVRNVHEP